MASEVFRLAILEFELLLDDQEDAYLFLLLSKKKDSREGVFLIRPFQERERGRPDETGTDENTLERPFGVALSWRK